MPERSTAESVEKESAEVEEAETDMAQSAGARQSKNLLNARAALNSTKKVSNQVKAGKDIQLRSARGGMRGRCSPQLRLLCLLL